MDRKMCCKSIFMYHCETSNIWTHLLTTIYFWYHLILLMCRYFRIPLQNNQYNKLYIDEYLLIQMLAASGIIFATGISTFYHTFSCINDDIT